MDLQRLREHEFPLTEEWRLSDDAATGIEQQVQEQVVLRRVGDEINRVPEALP
jgi:hypothetical protein